MKDVAASKGMTVAQLALAWVLAEEVVSVALVGTRKPEEIEQNVKAAEWEMTPTDRDEIRAIVTG
ncbi:MAG: aldo/keto reductase [SAR202 cluster bacterium]|nr:aldo/keto reductase [SAR202 cluster bacterium]